MKQIVTQVVGGTLPPDPEFNEFVAEVQNMITSSGQALTHGDTEQLAKSIVDYVGSANFYLDTGAADVYVCNVIGSFKTTTAYRNGMVVKFRPTNTNTGASTINVSTHGIKDIKRADGSTALSAGDISTAYDCILRYDGTVFRLMSLGTLEVNNLIANTVSGTYSEISNITVGAPTASVAIPVPNASTYKFFKLRVQGSNFTAGTNLGIRINSDVAVNYTFSTVFMDGGTGVLTTNFGTGTFFPVFASVAAINSVYDITIDIGFRGVNYLEITGQACIYETGVGPIDGNILYFRYSIPTFTSLDLISGTGTLYDAGTEISLFARIP